MNFTKQCLNPSCNRIFKIYHKKEGLDKYCCTACRVSHHLKRNADARKQLELQADPERAKLMHTASESIQDWIKTAPKNKLSLTQATVQRMNRITSEEWIAEDKPWRCLECGKPHDHSVLYCDCPNSPKQPNFETESDF